MLTTAIECPRCSKPVYFKFSHMEEFSESDFLDEKMVEKIGTVREIIQKSGMSLPPNDAEITNPALEERIPVTATAFCPDCKQPVFFSMIMPRLHFINHMQDLHLARFSKPDYELKDTFIEILPQPEEPEMDDTWPIEIRQEFSDAQKMLKQNMSPSIIISTCRTVLDVSTKKLGGKGKNIFERIENLREMGVITKPIADWSHDIRKFGADATHDAEGTRKDAIAFVGFLKTFLNISFTLPKKIELRRKTPDEPQ